MTISDQIKLKDIQSAFSTLFPYLKLVFYSGHHAVETGSPKTTELDEEKTIGEVRSVHTDSTDLVISGDMYVSELEQLFDKKYGLNVQVFRKSGKLWMQTTATDNWTLAEQNRKGGSSVEAWIEQHEL
ncbi:MAG: hypothetical protein HUU01_11125 [Saprospiraceae bacterium]|nr:hypothetical protein [Saprospiraceae bacterium]